LLIGAQLNPGQVFELFCICAPFLLEPEEGTFFGPADDIVLAWRWYHRLQPRDVSSVGLLREGEEPMTSAWLRETQLTCSHAEISTRKQAAQ
jgi:hypothetical protein